MLDQLSQMQEEALAALEAVEDNEALNAWNKQYLGKKGALTLLLRSVGELPKEERPAFGQAANEAKSALEAAYEAAALANEHTKDRPWVGEMYLVAIYNRSYTPDTLPDPLSVEPHKGFTTAWGKVKALSKL